MATGRSSKGPKRDSIPIYTSAAQFTDFKELSKRSNSVVFKARCIVTDGDVAIKRFQKAALSPKEAVHVAREVHLMGILRGEPGVIHILGFFEDENFVYIVMEYCAGQDLYQCYVAEQRLDEGFAAVRVVAPLLATMHRLHTVHRIIHRDIKPENVLLAASGDVRLADFGTAINAEVEVPFLAVGTLDFMAPEVLSSRAPKGAVESPCTTPEMVEEAGVRAYDAKADVWSLGALAYELVVGEPPFYHEDAEQTRNLILGSAFLYFPTRYQNTPFSRFVSAAMTKNPTARPSAADLLRHEWLAQHGCAAPIDSQTSFTTEDTPPRSPNALNPLGAAGAKCRSPERAAPLSIHVDATCPIPSNADSGSVTKLVVPRRSGMSDASQCKSASVFDLSAAAAAAAAAVGVDEDTTSLIAAAFNAASLSEDDTSKQGHGRALGEERRRTGSGKLKRQLGSWLKSFRSRRHSANVNDSDVIEPPATEVN